MSIINKLKNILKPKNTVPTEEAAIDDTAVSCEKTEVPALVGIITAWFDKQGWKYEHRPPAHDRAVHHLILGFADKGHEWTCVFRIQEENQLVTMFGILEDTLPVTHYMAILMAFAKTNLNISYGNLELDPTDGEVRVKLAFDGEFTKVDETSLGCYMQAVAGMTELARNIIGEVMAEDSPSQFAGDYLDVSDEITAKVGDDKQAFFVPTRTQQ